MTDTFFEGRIFGPGLPGTGTAAAGTWRDDGSLLVTFSQQDHPRIVAPSPAVTAGGFNAAGIRLSWQAASGEYQFFIESEAAYIACTDSAPGNLAGQLAGARSARTRVERRFRVGMVLIGLLLALPLIGLGAFLFHSDTAAGWLVKRISFEQEAKLGDLVLAQLRLQMKLHDSGPAVTALSDIGARLTTGSRHTYRWLVAENSDINAFATPGGVVVVNAGLIREVGSAEELAGVLAHETAHTELRHGLRIMVKSLGLRALVSLIMGDAPGGVFTDAATRLTELKYSRQAEHEADREGLRRLVAARIDPGGMVRFYEKLSSEKRPAPPPILSTHPATGERLERLRREVANLREPWEPLPVDFKGAKESVRTLASESQR